MRGGMSWPSGWRPLTGRGRAVGWTLAALATTGLLVATLSGVGAANVPTADGLVVDIDDDGDATVTLVRTFELTSADEREAFEELAADETARNALAERFEARMATVATNAGTATDRGMEVADATAETRTEADGSIGIVRLSVSWEGLARTDGTRLVVSEPFASATTVDRPITLVAPDGYTIEATPTPDERRQGGQRATWEAGTDLGGFEATMTDDARATTDDQPGFGPVAAVLAGASLAIARRIRGCDERI